MAGFNIVWVTNNSLRWYLLSHPTKTQPQKACEQNNLSITDKYSLTGYQPKVPKKCRIVTTGYSLFAWHRNLLSSVFCLSALWDWAHGYHGGRPPWYAIGEASCLKDAATWSNKRLDASIVSHPFGDTRWYLSPFSSIDHTHCTRSPIHDQIDDAESIWLNGLTSLQPLSFMWICIAKFNIGCKHYKRIYFAAVFRVWTYQSTMMRLLIFVSTFLLTLQGKHLHFKYL